MSSYQSSTVVRAKPEDIFGFVSKPENISKYVSCIKQADLGVDDALHIKGKCPHGDFRGVGALHIETELLRMRWDSRANLYYRGWLKVADHGDHATVTIHVEFDPGADLDSNKEFAHLLRDHPTAIQEDLDKALAQIKKVCESVAAPA